ncbi:MAG: RusA family crossover junction endodeoxyribonuclease [Caulobacteraceae bacterium]|nr:RusA family crossover junction endodeoxyribonuclease [Caulobacteraceae bacterium]
MLNVIGKLIGQRYDLWAVDELGNRQMGRALAVRRTLQDVDERLRDVVLVGQLHCCLLVVRGILIPTYPHVNRCMPILPCVVYMQHIQLLLPWPPSVNHYWGQSGKSRFISKRGQQFRASVIESCKGVIALEGRLAVHITLFPPDRRKRDVDNILKALLDACEHAGCYEPGKK